MKIWKLNRGKEEGQALVEFALILPVLLLLVVAIIDFGWIFYHTSRMTNAAREATRILSVQKETDIEAIKTEIRSNLDEDLYLVADYNGSPYKIYIEIVRGMDTTLGYPVTRAYITGRLKPLTGLLGESFQQISGSAYMRLEYEYTASIAGE